MAIFNLTDITFRKEQRGPLQSLEDSQFKYNFTKYPIDLGNNYDKGHYMTIYINEQLNTQFDNGAPSGDVPTALSQLNTLQSLRGPSNAVQAVSSVASEIGTALSNSQTLSGFVNTITNFFSGSSSIGSSIGNVLGASKNAKILAENLSSNAVESINLAAERLARGNLRTIRRTTGAIALYMPDTLNFTYNQAYSDLPVYDQLGLLGTAGAAGISLIDAAKNKTSAGQVNLASFLLQALRESGVGGTAGGTIGTIGLAALGVASNPSLELLYTSPSFRSFRFDFMFYPRNEQEAFQVKNIIDTLKFHQAPEIAAGSGGKFLIPPSEFDIKFYYNGTENPNIPKISTCVLEQIDVDYAPNGFSAYEVPGQNFPSAGGTGMPVAIRMSLQFKETQILTKELLNRPLNTTLKASSANLQDFSGGYDPN